MLLENMMNTKLGILTIAILTITSQSWAEELPTLPTPKPVFFEPTPEISTPQEQAWQETSISTPPTLNLPKIDPNTLNAQELQELNMMYAEDLISMAVINQNWEILQELLEIYQSMPQFDSILTEYAEGAMLRKQGKQQQAIEKYKNILTKRPELSYVKLDLALMYNENKEFKNADKLLAELEQEQLSEQVQAVITVVRQAIKKNQSIRPNISFNYEATDNVNNASSEKVITWFGREWQKEDSSLPQSAHGIRYNIGLSKDSNISGNHNTVVELEGSGVYYWDNKEYNEQSISVSLGYKYANLSRSWQVAPFFEQNWLDGDKYNSNTGIAGRYGQSIGKQDYLQLFANYANKRYDNDRLASRYDGNIATIGAALNHRIDNNTLIYGGIDSTLDSTKDKELSSTRVGVRSGIIQSFDNGIGLNANIRYARRNFDSPATFVYNFTRQDNEYQAGLSLWHDKFIYKGFRPQANIRYLKIDSNMPAFYSRDGVNYFVSIEKMF